MIGIGGSTIKVELGAIQPIADLVKPIKILVSIRV